MIGRFKPILVLASVLMTACGGGAGDVINTGGGNTGNSGLVERFVGIWQLSSGWSSNATDEALLVIREPDSNGRAEMLLYDFTDEADVASQCYRPPFGNGEAYESLDEQVFIDNFDVFTQGKLTSVTENSISINFIDANDINGNSDTSEELSTTATRVGQVESAIEPLCTN